MAIQAAISRSEQANCFACLEPMPQNAKFCGSCGTSSSAPLSAQIKETQLLAHQSAMFGRAEVIAPTTQPPVNPTTPMQAPSFAKVQPKSAQEVSPELVAELGTLLVSLARERIIMVFMCIVFLVINFIGFSIAMKAFFGFGGDEVTRCIIALVPLLFINAIGMVTLQPIKACKKEIARLKDRITYVRFKIDFQFMR